MALLCRIASFPFIRTSVCLQMYKSSQYPLKERNCDPIDLPISSFSKIDAVQDYNDDDDDGTKSEIRSAESEVTPQTVYYTSVLLYKILEY